jgi:hypothetical protein
LFSLPLGVTPRHVLLAAAYEHRQPWQQLLLQQIQKELHTTA